MSGGAWEPSQSLPEVGPNHFGDNTTTKSSNPAPPSPPRLLHVESGQHVAPSLRASGGPESFSSLPQSSNIIGRLQEQKKDSGRRAPSRSYVFYSMGGWSDPSLFYFFRSFSIFCLSLFLCAPLGVAHGRLGTLPGVPERAVWHLWAPSKPSWVPLGRAGKVLGRSQDAPEMPGRCSRPPRGIRRGIGNRFCLDFGLPETYE